MKKKRTRLKVTSIKAMRYSDLVKPLGIRSEQAAEMVGSPNLFDAMAKAGWIKPVVNRHKCKLWDVSDVEQCWQRLKSGDFPHEVST